MLFAELQRIKQVTSETEAVTCQEEDPLGVLGNKVSLRHTAELQSCFRSLSSASQPKFSDSGDARSAHVFLRKASHAVCD